MPRRTIMLSLMVLVAGCQTAARFDQQVPPTADVRRQIVEGAKRIVYDPYSIRDAEISNMVPAGKQGNYHVCVRANAKNLYGGYTGQQGTLVNVVNNRVYNAFAQHPFCNTAELKYRPFPELEAL